jgi:hypothetical protein
LINAYSGFPRPIPYDIGFRAAAGVDEIEALLMKRVGKPLPQAVHLAKVRPVSRSAAMRLD